MVRLAISTSMTLRFNDRPFEIRQAVASAYVKAPTVWKLGSHNRRFGNPCHKPRTKWLNGFKLSRFKLFHGHFLVFLGTFSRRKFPLPLNGIKTRLFPDKTAVTVDAAAGQFSIDDRFPEFNNFFAVVIVVLIKIADLGIVGQMAAKCHIPEVVHVRAGPGV